MENDTKSRSESSVPEPETAKQLSEEEKRALELSGQIEHEQGRDREDTAKKAERLEGGKG